MLPRGRHPLSPEEVQRHQRRRIVAAVAEQVATYGYAGLTVSSIIAEARVSRTTFYGQFPNKREAVLGAHDTISRRFIARLEDACEDETHWPLKVKRGIEATVDFAAAHPAEARLLAMRFEGADATLGERLRASQRKLIDLLEEGRRYPRGDTLPAITEEALVGAISMVLARGVDGTEVGAAADLRSQLVEFTLAFYLGAAAAAEVLVRES